MEPSLAPPGGESPSTWKKGETTLLALYTFDGASNPTALKFQEKDSIIFLSHSSGGWVLGRHQKTNEKGYFPLSYVKKHTCQLPKATSPLPKATSPLPIPKPNRNSPKERSSLMLPPPPRNEDGGSVQSTIQSAPLPPPLTPNTLHTLGLRTQSFSQGVPVGQPPRGETALTITKARASVPPNYRQRPLSSIASPRNTEDFGTKAGFVGGSSGLSVPQPNFGGGGGGGGGTGGTGGTGGGGGKRRMSASMIGYVPEGEDSIISNKKNTLKVLDNWLKTKRPEFNELKERGILSTDGNIDGISFGKRNLLGFKKELIGMPLDELRSAVPGRDIPFIVDQCVTYIRRNAMTLHGVFRVSPNQQELSRLRSLYKSPFDVVDLEKKVKDPHVVAGLLKLFLTSLPEPLIPFTLYSPLIEAYERLHDQDNPKKLMKEYQILLKLIPVSRMPLVCFLFQFLYDLTQHSEKNMMTPSNLGIVFGPNLIKPQNETQETMLNMTKRDVVTFLVAHYKVIFCREEDQS